MRVLGVMLRMGTLRCFPTRAALLDALLTTATCPTRVLLTEALIGSLSRAARPGPVLVEGLAVLAQQDAGSCSVLCAGWVRFCHVRKAMQAGCLFGQDTVLACLCLQQHSLRGENLQCEVRSWAVPGHESEAVIKDSHSAAPPLRIRSTECRAGPAEIC